MTEPPDSTIEPASPLTDGHNRTELSPHGDVPPANATEANIGEPDSRSAATTPDCCPTGALDPRTGAWISGGCATIPEGVSEPSAEGCPGAVRAPSGEGVFGASPPPFLSPFGGLPEGTPVSPTQVVLAHRPWEHSTGPRTQEGKQRSARNGKSRQLGVLSVRELRAYKKEQKNLLETLDRALQFASETNDLLHAQGQADAASV